uniref:Uncharacterized protein n=1 Tax=Oryza glumipatula TaxID=40148 RepID=A0A0D9Y9T4_9ORYZ
MTGMKGGPPAAYWHAAIINPSCCNLRSGEEFEQRRGREAHPHAAGLQATACPTVV